MKSTYPETVFPCFEQETRVEYNHNPNGNRYPSCVCEYRLAANIDEKITGKIKLYSSMENGEIRVESPETTLPVSLDLYDLPGKLLYSTVIREKFINVNTISQQPNAYIFIIPQTGKSLQTGKIDIN